MIKGCECEAGEYDMIDPVSNAHLMIFNVIIETTMILRSRLFSQCALVELQHIFAGEGGLGSIQK